MTLPIQTSRHVDRRYDDSDAATLKSLLSPESGVLMAERMRSQNPIGRTAGVRPCGAFTPIINEVEDAC